MFCNNSDQMMVEATYRLVIKEIIIGFKCEFFSRGMSPAVN